MEFRSKALQPKKQSHFKRNLLIAAFGAATFVCADAYLHVAAAVHSVEAVAHGVSAAKNLVSPAAHK